MLDSDDPTDPPDAIVTHLYDAGTIRNVKSTWLFQEMHGGTAPLSDRTLPVRCCTGSRRFEFCCCLDECDHG